MFSSLIKQFKDNIDGLRDFVEFIDPLLSEKEKETIKSETVNLLPLLFGFSEIDKNFKMTDELKSIIHEKVGNVKTDVSERKNGKSINIMFEKHNIDFDRAFKKVIKSNAQKELLYKSSLMSLCSTAEWFVYQLFHKYYKHYSFPLEHKDKFFSLDDLKEFSTIEDAKNFLISSKIDKIMRQGFEEWFTSLKKKEIFELKLLQVEKYKNKLTEIFQRRHLLVHNGGIVNEFYLQKVDKEGSNKYKKGDKILLQKEYILNSIDIIEFTFLLIAFELWQKLDKKNCDKRIDHINDLIIDYIINEKYESAENLSYFYQSEKDLKEHHILVGQLNYWQSIKWQGRYDDIKIEVEDADYTAKDAFFKVGYYAICDNKDLFMRCLDEALSNNKLGIDDAKTWPIFKEMRKEIDFDKIIEKYRQ